MIELSLEQVKDLLELLRECTKPECRARSELIIYFLNKYFEKELSNK